MNSEKRASRYSAEREPTRLDRSGWGPGGRRFKSCLPDFRKALLTQGFRRVRSAWAAAWGCESRVEEMIPRQAEGNCVVVRRGGKEAGGVTRGLRDTNRVGGGAVWASQHAMAKPVVIKRPPRKCGRRAGKAVVLIRGDLHRCPGMPDHRCGVRRVARDGAGREAGARGGEVSRGRSTSRDRGGGWKGPNAKPSVGTFVLVAVAVTAAKPFGGLAGRVLG